MHRGRLLAASGTVEECAPTIATGILRLRAVLRAAAVEPA